MRVTITGMGMMARAIATRALAGEHLVTLIGTHISKAEKLADEMIGEGEADPSEQIDGELVVLAVPFTEAPSVVRQFAEQLSGRVVIDVTNPVDFGPVEPLTGPWLEPFNSGAELIAAEVPEGAFLVKAFNVNLAGPLLARGVDDIPLDLFIAGDAEDAKHRVAQLVTDSGMRPIDAGALKRARELEALGFLHMTIQAPLGTHFGSAIKVLPITPPRG